MEFLSYYAPLAIGLFLLGTGLKLGRWLSALVTRKKFTGRTERALDTPSPLGAIEALKLVLLGPIRNFYLKANKTWARGYMLYHIAIVTILAGYGISALILGYHLASGNPVPDVARGLEESHSYTIPNLLAIIFGNGEHLQASFLFGSLAPAFVGLTWLAVAVGLAGNFNLLLTIVRKKSGAVVGNLDKAARGMRTSGHFSWEHLVVTLLVFGIIITELLARLELVEGMVYYHAALGLTIFAIFPFTYLFHMVYAFIAVYYATRRRMNRTVA